MELNLKRIFKGPNYTIGHLYIDGKYIMDSIEDVDRGLKDSMSLEEIKNIKVKHKTAIPTGIYKVTLNVISPRYSKSSFYQLICLGKVPRLLNVKGFEGVLIHSGNTAEDSSGCILCGYNKVKGKVINSRDAFKKLYSILLQDPNNITINIE